MRASEFFEDISRRGVLRGIGAAALAGAAGSAVAGQFTSSDDLNKDSGSVEKVWKPRMAELKARCDNILKSFKSIAASVNPAWVPIIDQIKLEVTLGDTTLKSAMVLSHKQTTPTVTWQDIKNQNPTVYTVDVWSKVYPNISYRGSSATDLTTTVDFQIRPDGTIVNTALRVPSKDPAWDKAVLGGISTIKSIPPKPGDNNPGNQVIRLSFPIKYWTMTNGSTNQSTYKIFVETTVFWDSPDSTLAWVLGHEIGHLVNNHSNDASPAQRRAYELEADEVGAVLAQKIGYDRANFFQWLYNQKAEHMKNADADQSHPDPNTRVNNLKQKTGFDLAAVKYIDSMANQFKNGLA